MPKLSKSRLLKVKFETFQNSISIEFTEEKESIECELSETEFKNADFTRIAVESVCDHFNLSYNFIISIYVHQLMNISNYIFTYSHGLMLRASNS